MIQSADSTAKIGRSCANIGRFYAKIGVWVWALLDSALLMLEVNDGEYLCLYLQVCAFISYLHVFRRGWRQGLGLTLANDEINITILFNELVITMYHLRLCRPILTH